MADNVIKIKRGANVKLTGAAPHTIIGTIQSKNYAIKPTDFHGITPKLSIKVGDTVKAGSTIFFDKKNPVIKFASPISGTVKEIIRGAKRKILEIIVESDEKGTSESFKPVSLETTNRDQIIEQLTNAGLWPFVIQRPFSVIANPADTPKAIYVSGFDSNPLAPDYDFILEKELESIQVAIDTLSKLTPGGIHLGLKDNSSVLNGLKNLKSTNFKGPHPAGNVGVQIHHTNPINKGEVIWTLNVQSLVSIGKFISTGKYDVIRTIAITGSDAKETGYAQVLPGVDVSEVLKGRIANENTRVISGNPFTGEKISPKGYLGFYHDQLTLIPEVIDAEFFGWMIPKLSKKSFSRTFFSWLMPGKEYTLNTTNNGEERAFVMSGQYEKFLPMDVYPVQLLKSILINDIELMENLGIYEVAPEDFALCEFACTSKQELQMIVREGLDNIKKEFA